MMVIRKGADEGIHALQSLRSIQEELKAPKNQHNKFGGYKYRSAEDILEAVKPIAHAAQCIVIISDKTIKSDGSGSGDFISAEATLVSVKDGSCVSVEAQAGIDWNRKGMDVAQSFGSSSSYARKYAMNGLFAIDDTKDPDGTNTHGKGSAKAPQAPSKKPLTEKALLNMVAKAKEGAEGIALVNQYMSSYTITAQQKDVLAKVGVTL